jgi:hypothetical protein
MRQIFNDIEYDRKFQRDGYLVVDGIISKKAKELYSYFTKLESGVDAKFYASLWSKDVNYRKLVDTKVKEYLKPIGEKLLYNYQPLFSDLLVKKPSFKHKIYPHQDWMFVDEPEYNSVYMWCPLIDVNKRNGCLQVFPGSHKIFREIRGSNISLSYEEIQDYIMEKYMVPISLSAGNIIFFNQATIHSSPPNISLRKRISMGLLFLPREAPIIHYHLHPEKNTVEKLKVDYEFFMNFSSNENFRDGLYSRKIIRPQNAELLEEFSLSKTSLSINDLEHKIISNAQAV